MANMITNLVKEPHPTKSGRAIAVHEFPINNYQIHKCLQFLSRMILAMLEGQSNNMKAELVPRDVRSIRAGWLALKSAWDSAMEHNDPPSGTHEFNYKILLPTGVEVQKVSNFKIKVMVMEFHRLAEVMIGCDSAGSSGNIALGSQNDIETQMQICESELDKWLGTGADNTAVGEFVPVFKHLGVLEPDPSMNFADIQEPTADQPDYGRPDTIDTAIIGD